MSVPLPGTGAGHDLVFDIGGLAGRVVMDAPRRLTDQLLERYDAFAVPAAPWVKQDFRLRIRLRGDPCRLPANRPLFGPEAPAPRASVRGGRLEVMRADFSATMRSREDDAGAEWEGDAVCDEGAFSLETLLRALWSVLLPLHEGMLVHACAVRAGNGAILFPGPSGAGKTTLASKAHHRDDVLSDELVVLRRSTGGGWRVFSTPFWGGGRPGGRSIAGWPLRGIAFLAHGDRLSVQPLGPAEAAGRLLQTVLSFEPAELTARTILAMAADVCSRAPAVELRSAKSTPLRDIERRLGFPDRPADAAWSRRETISEIRRSLRREGGCALSAAGTSMTPGIRNGDVLFVEPIRRGRPAPGEVVVYWRPGRTPEEDRLVCHRVVGRARGTVWVKGDAAAAIERYERGVDVELLGKVRSVLRRSSVRSVGMPARAVLGLARSLASLWWGRSSVC